MQLPSWARGTAPAEAGPGGTARLGACGAGEGRGSVLRGGKNLEDCVQPGDLEQVAQARTEVGQLDGGDARQTLYAPNTMRVPVEGMISFCGSSRCMAIIVLNPVQCMGMR